MGFERLYGVGRTSNSRVLFLLRSCASARPSVASCPPVSRMSVLWNDEKLLRYVERAVATGLRVESGGADFLYSGLALALGFYAYWGPTCA
jgi:hypothetical protein